ncbi:MAG: EF-hand domain-containing protein [Stenotrophomonas sp.]
MSQRTPMILLAMLLATSAAGVAIAAAPAATPAATKPAVTRLDSNGDGVIDRKEAAAHPRLAERFDQLDKNKDGKLSAAEMPAPRHRGGRRGGYAGHNGMHGQRHSGLMMRGMDTNQDGRISAAEYQAHFDKLDVNKDGYIDQADRVARAEQRRAEWFAKADTDKDGKLSPAELEAARAMADARHRHDGPRAPMPVTSPAKK